MLIKPCADSSFREVLVDGCSFGFLKINRKSVRDWKFPNFDPIST